MITYLTIKWGTKYGPEYVNRLYRALRSYNADIRFICYTDDSRGIDEHIEIHDVDLLRDQPGKPNTCFTTEKLFLSQFHKQGQFCFLDLDILILNDLTSKLERDVFPHLQTVGLIQNRWSDNRIDHLVPNHGRNFINSSMVVWKDKQLKFFYDFYQKNRYLIEIKYTDLDFWLFQTFKDVFTYPDRIAYSYAEGSDEQHRTAYVHRDQYYIVLFNTSHGRGIELDQATGWASDVWRRFG